MTIQASIDLSAIPAAARPDLHALLREWRDILRLHDWDIKVSYIDQRDMDGYDGRTWHEKKYRLAVIRIVDPNTRRAPGSVIDEAFPVDVEAVLVHEMLHLIVPGESTDDVEYAVETLARSFVRMRRQLRAATKPVEETAGAS